MDSSIDLGRTIENLNTGFYPVLGTGSGRRVYDLQNRTVLKAAKNVRGYAQNQAEYIISAKDNSDLFAQVLFISRDNHYLLMEKAEPIPDFSTVKAYFRVLDEEELFQQDGALRSLSAKYNLIASDLCRPANWGTIDGRPVIIDYGFTGRIRRQYYSVF